jgi:hypothetical protein
VPDDVSVLELGMEAGANLKLLSKHFRATGSDDSQFFLDRYMTSNHIAAAPGIVTHENFPTRLNHFTAPIGELR